MSEEQDKMFHIKHGNREYVVMTTKMHREIMLGGDFAKTGKFLGELGSKTMVVNTPLYTVLMKVITAYEEKREEFSIGR